MTERRIDPFTGRTVLIAAARKGLGGPRPGGLPTPPGRCPFCPGHEADTEVTVARWPDDGDWQVRVVRNKYPLVSEHDGLGVHEVVIDAREHDTTLGTLSVAHLTGLLGVVRARVSALEARDDIAAVTPFRNRGRRSGSSQPHPHSQIIATSWVPDEVALRWERLKAEPVYARELEREAKSPALLFADPELVVSCPWASTRPFEVRMMPTEPRGGFGAATDAQLAALARALKRVCAALPALGIEDYNLVFRVPPSRVDHPRASWHLDLLPRRGGDAGFELASRERVVVVPPEDAAGRYRDAL